MTEAVGQQASVLTERAARGAAAPVQVIRLRGTQAEMGAQHGRIVRELGGFEPVLRYYPRMPGYLLRGTGGGAPLGRVLFALATPALEALLVRLERRRPPELHDRSRAFFEALGEPARMTRYLLVMDLFQNLVGLGGRLGLVGFARRAAAAAPPACSSIAVWGAASRGGALRFARNFDFPGIGIWDRGASVVLCAPERGLRYGFVTTRGADVPGVTAFNEAGLAIAAHTRFHREVAFDGAGIVDLGHEIARRAETIADAARIARERKVASTWGIAVASARERRAATIETNAAGVAVVEPEAEDPFLVTTNHYRHAWAQRGEIAPMPAFTAHSHGRLEMLAGAAREAARARGLAAADLAALLGSHRDQEGVERAAGGVPAQPYTVQSVVVEPEARTIHVSAAASPAGKGPYAAVAWEWEGEVGAHAVEAEPGALASTTRFSAGRAAEAHAAFVEAARQGGLGAPLAPIEAALERAVALDPDEPAYRYLLGGLRLKALDGRGALAHLEHGLGVERAEFRRGQLLLAAARAADLAGERERAAALRRELLETRHDLLAEHRAAAVEESRRPLTPRRLRAAQVSIALVDVRC